MDLPGIGSDYLIIVCRISVPCLQKYLNLCKMITVFKTSHGYFEKGHFERRLFEIGPFEFDNFKNRLEMNQLKICSFENK